ncbi:MAG: hypothetical protein L0H93_18860, partial [Nocardioides sp.]|nr:hypothetical protein [Nocardioides sp.]
MTDDESDGPDPAIRRRQQAQGAAGDLARMGIDPRSLGLGDQPPSPPPSQDRRDPAVDEASNVVQLRPGTATPTHGLT